MKQILTIAIFLISFSAINQTVTAQVQSPAEFLGYELGERYTPHHRVLGYVNHVAEESDWVTIHQYGTTYEHRELVYLVVTSPDNHSRIDEIRTNNLKLTGLVSGEIVGDTKPITWLSYNIHGNETSSSEAAMKTLHELVGSVNSEAEQWLSDSVVIMDPMINPDGRDRYVNWFNGIIGSEINPDIVAREHHENWPGGRSNHYYFDLNRDWAWQTQKESQQRSVVYQEWMPHVHVDFHEQSYTSPYYFAPAAEPLHLAITDWQREFQTTIGKNNAEYFDDQGWLYFTKEIFDLFYPSFGDTWPTFNGAIGMTYEKAGGGLGGAGIITPEGDTLTLEDRLTHHFTSGISTVEVTSQHADRVVSEFSNYFENSVNNPVSTYKTFVVKGDNHPDKINNLLSFLDTQQISYGRAGSSSSRNGFNYATGSTEDVSISEDDIIISAYQPKSKLVRVLFEPNPELVDSLTYDITAWEAHYRFGLTGYALESRIDANSEISIDELRSTEMTGSSTPYAFVLDWKSMDDARFLAEITKHDVRSRFSVVEFEVDGRSFDRGSLVITRDNNRHLGDEFNQIVMEAAEKHQRSIHGATTGFVGEGSDFGSSNVRFIKKPEIAVLMGEGTRSLQAGEVWHFFDQQLHYPTTLINTEHISRTDFDQFNTIVLPSGSYSGVFDDEATKKLQSWVRSGGKLIAMGNTISTISGMEGFNISSKINNDVEPDNSPESKLHAYGDRQRANATNTTPGSIYNTTLDVTHPLAFGYDESYFSLKVDASSYDFLDNGWNVGTVRSNAHISGFVGNKAKQNLENSLTFGVQSYGSGDVVYMVDNPLFRGFWENGKLLFVNSLFFVGN
ncbi:MAG: M14 family zinc carboxypeptidase [Balneolaceae bacterium]